MPPPPLSLLLITSLLELVEPIILKELNLSHESSTGSEPRRQSTLGWHASHLSLQLLDPVLGPRKGVRVRYVVDDDGGLRAAVVHRRQRMVSLLKGVPSVNWKMSRSNGCEFEDLPAAK